jgi:hypothetical protein
MNVLTHKISPCLLAVLYLGFAVLATTPASAAMCSKFTERPGEQILSFSKDGRVSIWADVNAKDTPAAQKRYEDRFYYTNQRMTACGYNLFTLGGL